MVDDINKKITIDVEVNTDGLQQITQYKTALDNLRSSINGLGKPLADASNSMNALSNGAAQVAATVAGGIKAITDSTTKTENQIFNIKKIFAKKAGQLTQEQQAAIQKSEIDSAQKISDSVFTIVTKGIEQQSDAKSRALENERASVKNNANLTAAEKAQQDAALVKQENQIKLKAFKEEQKANIAQAVMNGAIAVTKAEAELGPIAGTLALGAIVAQTAAQIATIERQQPPQALARGGYFRSDGKGSVLPGYSRSDNTNAFLRSGEAVVVSEAMRDPWARNLVSAINVAYGGRDFSVPNVSRGYAVGGIFTDGGNANRYYNQPVNDQKNLANTVAYQMINNFPPVYVDVKDVNNQQNILAQTISRVNL